MPILSRWNVPVPEHQSLPDWVFGSPTAILPEFTSFIDAEDPSKALSLSDFRHLAKRIGQGLRRHGLEPGNRVLLFSGNSLLVPSIFMGVIMAGGIFTGASPAFNARELAYQLKDSGATIVISSADVLDTAMSAADAVDLPHDRVFEFDGSINPPSPATSRSGASHWSNLLATDSEAESFQWFNPRDPLTTTCCLNYSSGTTGKPKGVEVTHYAYIANGEVSVLQRQLQYEALKGPYVGRSLCFMPLYHAAAQTTFSINAPKMGVITYIMAKYDLERLLQHIQTFQITELLSAPPIILALATNPICRKYDLSSIKNVVCGTAPLAQHVAQKASQLWPDGRITVRQGWGMTELTCLGLFVDPRRDGLWQMVGEAAPNAAIKLMDGDEEIKVPNRRGELWFSGPSLMKGYWANKKATDEVFVEEGGRRWLKTGDIAYVDSYGPGGNVHIVDRVKEIIKSKGFQVAPAELEEILLDHPEIVDAGVIGVHVDGHEVPRGYVVRAPGSDLSSHEIRQWVDAKVAPYKRLRGGIVLIDQIPRVPSGKILRRVLRERAQLELQPQTSIRAKLA